MSSAASLPRFTDCLGVSLETGTLRLCLLRRGAQPWEAVMEISQQESFAAELRVLLSNCPVRRGVRRRAIVAVDASRVVIKLLPGVLSSDFPAHGRTVVENPSRYFLLPRDGSVVSEPWVSASGDVWAAAFRRGDIETLFRTLSECGWGNVIVAPAASLSTASSSPGASLELQLKPDAEPAIDVELRAFHAAKAAPSLRMMAPRRAGIRRAELPAGLVPASLFLLATLAGVFAVEALRSKAERNLLLRDAAKASMVSATADSLAKISRQLSLLHEYSGSRVSLLTRLAALAELMDTLGTIERLIMQDSTAELSLLASNGVGIPGAFGTLSWVRGTSLVGSVFREPPPSDRERITLRLQLAPRRVRKSSPDTTVAASSVASSGVEE